MEEDLGMFMSSVVVNVQIRTVSSCVFREIILIFYILSKAWKKRKRKEECGKYVEIGNEVYLRTSFALYLFFL